MAEHEALLAQFMAITGVDNGRATFFLEAAGWNMDVSVQETMCDSEEHLL